MHATHVSGSQLHVVLVTSTAHACNTRFWLAATCSTSNQYWWLVHRCLQDKAPQYLSNYCVPVSEVASRQQLRSASRHQLLLIPRYRLRTFGRRAFVVAGPTFWNSLADELRTYSSDRFKLALKTSGVGTYLSGTARAVPLLKVGRLVMHFAVPRSGHRLHIALMIDVSFIVT